MFAYPALTGILTARPAPQKASGQVQATTISAGITTVSSGPGPLGIATATIQTEALEGVCGLTCPTSRDSFMWMGTRQGSLVKNLSITVDGKPVDVPAAAFIGMYDPSWAMVQKQGSSFILTVALAAGGAGYFADRIYFNAREVERTEGESSDCGIANRTEFLYTRSEGVKSAEGPPSAVINHAWQHLRLGKTALRFHTSQGNVFAIIDQQWFGQECAQMCPNTKTALGGSSGEQIFLQGIDFLVGDKLVYGPSVGNLVAKSATAFLGTDNGEFSLWIKAGHGTGEEFEEIRFNSKSVTETKWWQPSQHVVGDKRIYPPGCE